MKHSPSSVVFLLLVAAPFSVFASAVVINEVMFDPAGDDSVSGVGKEWIEIYNEGIEAVDLTNWQLYPDGIGYFNFPKGFFLAAKSIAVIHLRASGADSARDLYFPAAGSNMGNTSGSAALFSGEPRGKDTIKSFVEWGKGGETWESDAEKAVLWTKGTFVDVSSLSEGNSIALRLDGDTRNGKGAWMVDSSPTEGVVNARATPPSAPSETPPTAGSPTVPVPASPPLSFIFPAIKVYAGEDGIAITGAETNFSGYAFGTNDKPIENARFWWNFGDGETKEGKNIAHSFKIPGKYTVGLHVSFEGYAASDYLRIAAVPNKIYASDVLKGESGFIRLSNPIDMDIEIGGWTIEDSGKNVWVIPSKTKIGARSEIGLANGVTGLLKGTSSAFTVRFPNASVALIQNDYPIVASGIKPVLDSSDTHEPAAGTSTVTARKLENAAVIEAKKLNKVGSESKKETDTLSSVDEKKADKLPAIVSESAPAVKSFYFFFAAAGLSAAAAAGFFIIKSFFL